MPVFGPHAVIHETAIVHETALIHGRVRIGAGASVWPYSVMRAEVFEIVIGEHTNIQDFVMVHVGRDTPTIVGKACSVAHHATLHGCEIGDRTLIGINATIMDGSKVGANSIVAGHAIVSEGAVFPDNAIIAGAPAKLIKTRDCGAANAANAAFYCINARNYQSGRYVLNEEDGEAIQEMMKLLGA